MEKFNLTDRQVEDIDNLEDILLAPMEFDAVNRIISDEKERSIAYLKENL